MPNVRVGSIVDIQMSYPGMPREWRFQDLIPVAWSELILPPTQYVEFQKKFVGYEPLHISSTYRWVGKDMPAFKSEPYINSPTNYLTKFEIEISNIHVPGYISEHYTGSWSEVNQFFLTAENFGQLMNNPGLYLNNDVRIIREMDLTDEEKIRQIIDLVKEKIKWDKNNQVFPSYDLGYIYRTRNIGNAADININLIIGLRKLGFEVYPAILSTRDNGYINRYWPTVDKFNYVIAYLELNGKKYFLDATEKNNPPGLLPERCLNGPAFIIDEFASGWTDLPQDKAEIIKVNGNFELVQTGEIQGKITFIRQQYGAVRFRDKYMEFNSLEDYYNSFEKENPGVLVKQCIIQNIDSICKDVIDEYEISITNRSSVIGDMIYIEPLLFLKIADNPFKPENRVYPVDYTVPSDEIIMLNILLPDGYSVEELPVPALVVLPDKTTEFMYTVNNFSNSVQVTCKFKINKAVFLQSEYPNLREFYNMLITKLSEPIIIKKD
jgi:hypothetical protein